MDLKQLPPKFTVIKGGNQDAKSPRQSGQNVDTGVQSRQSADTDVVTFFDAITKKTPRRQSGLNLTPKGNRFFKYVVPAAVLAASLVAAGCFVTKHRDSVPEAASPTPIEQTSNLPAASQMHASDVISIAEIRFGAGRFNAAKSEYMPQASILLNNSSSQPVEITQYGFDVTGWRTADGGRGSRRVGAGDFGEPNMPKTIPANGTLRLELKMPTITGISSAPSEMDYKIRLYVVDNPQNKPTQDDIAHDPTGAWGKFDSMFSTVVWEGTEGPGRTGAPNIIVPLNPDTMMPYGSNNANSVPRR